MSVIEVVNVFIAEFLEGSVSKKIKDQLIANLNDVGIQENLKSRLDEAVQQVVNAAVAAVPKTQVVVEKKVRDPNAPKAKKTAYMYFMTNEDVRKEVASSYDRKLSFPEMSSALANVWKGLNAEEKKPWEELAKEDALRYAGEMKNYVRPSDEQLLAAYPQKTRGRSRSPAARKPKDAPVNPRTAYVLYGIAVRPHVREQYPKADAKEMLSLIAAYWKEADPATKAEFAKAAAEDKVRYDNELAEYKLAHPDYQPASRATSPSSSRAASPSSSRAASPIKPTLKPAPVAPASPIKPTLKPAPVAPASPVKPTLKPAKTLTSVKVSAV